LADDVLPAFMILGGILMKNLMMGFPQERTFQQGFEEYLLDCKARNLREGTLNHYKDSVKSSCFPENVMIQ